MQIILDHIQDKQSDFRQHPFFAMLVDDTIDIHHRMSFAPAMAPFVMNLADIFRYRLRDEVSTDPIQRIINSHTYIDDSHWQMYLRDIDTLNDFGPKGTTDTIRFLWADRRSKTRSNSYDIIALATKEDSIMRLVVLQSIEATGGVAFPVFTRASNEYRQITGKELVYFGAFHEELESGHIMGTDSIETKLASIAMSPEMEQRAKVIVDVVFAGFSGMLDELLAYVHSNLEVQPRDPSS